ncbi:MAG: tyrosine-type recombinase/integrase [Bryobacteraceae bacterium]
MLNLYRRHLKTCPYRVKGEKWKEGMVWTKCSCPIWCDGELNGKRYRHSLGTRNWGRAGLRLAKLEAPGARQPKPIPEAIKAFHTSVGGLALATRTKYQRVLRYLEALAIKRGLRSMDEIGVEDIDAYHASRTISGVTWLKELEILRQFFQFCIVRKWADENPAAGVEKPKNLKLTEVVPYTREEVIRILAACDGMGRGPYERLRARATILLLRYTALRIADVALLKRDRVRDGQINVRTMKTGQCVWLPVHPELQAALDILPAPRGGEAGYFFWSGNGAAESMVRAAERTLTAVFKAADVAHAHAHRFRHTLATELLEQGWTYEDVAEVLGNSAAIVRKHYAKWSRGRQSRLTDMMKSVFAVQNWYTPEKQQVSAVN